MVYIHITYSYSVNNAVLLEITELTDGKIWHTSIAGKEYPDIEHSFDIWHGAKNFGKRLGAVSAF